jgi:hypothetical protein
MYREVYGDKYTLLLRCCDGDSYSKHSVASHRCGD